MLDILDVVLPVFLVIGFGYLAARSARFPEAAVDNLMAFAQNFAIPCLLFRAISAIDLGSAYDWRLLLSYYGGATACFAGMAVVSRVVFGRSWEDSIVIGFACFFANSVLLGLPITERAYGAAALEANYVLISLNAPFCYGVGILAMEIVRNRGRGGAGTARAVLRAIFKNALVLAVLMGFAFNLTGLRLPGAVADGMDLMARAGLPAALFALGGVLFRYKPAGDLKIIAIVVGVSLVLRPVLTEALALATALELSGLRSAVLTAAMAPGVNAYIFANMYGRAKRVAASSVLIATALSVLTLSGWILLLP